MKYLVTEIQTFDTGAIATPTYAFDNRNSAEAKFHNILGAAAVSALPEHACVMFTSDGRLLRNECYRHVVEPEPTPEPEEPTEDPDD